MISWTRWKVHCAAALLSLLALLLSTSSSSAQFGLSGNSAFKNLLPMILGRRASLADWPAVGSLRYTNSTAAVSGYVCGGSVIAPRWFLTAAHCVVRNADQQTLVGAFPDDKGNHLDGTLEVVLGHDDLRSTTLDSVYPIEAIVVHEAFLSAYKAARQQGLEADAAADRAAVVAGHDIALVQLKRPWEGSPRRALDQG